jgi:pyridoxine kinase
VSYQKILVVQDISCVGQCSLTVALPILSACGLECCILPSAVLSTHTGGDFKGYTFRDLSDDIPAICRHWEAQGIRFDAIYTGYLGSARQAEMVEHIMKTLLKPEGLKIVDPAMGDNGRLYAGLDEGLVDAMRHLCRLADVILPNITEACLLTGQEYRESHDEKYITSLLSALDAMGAKRTVLTGVSYGANTLGVLTHGQGSDHYHQHHRVPRMFHGTGDVYASAFTGAYLQGKSLFEAAGIATDFTLACIENTTPEHWYGVRFEPVLPKLIEMLK